MGVAQHHDAVSGTEKQEVVFDYAQRLSIGIDNAIVSIRIISHFKYKLTYKVIQNVPIISSRVSSVKLLQNFYQNLVKHHHHHQHNSFVK